MTDRLDLTGAWFGRYSYPRAMAADVPFIAALTESDGGFTGSISEPNRIGLSSDHLNAIVTGVREGRTVRFTKLYDGASDAAHAVAYDGLLSFDGTLLAGRWHLDDLSGGFEMRRTHAALEEEERYHAEEIVTTGRQRPDR